MLVTRLRIIGGLLGGVAYASLAAEPPAPTPPSPVYALQAAALADRRAYATLQSLTEQVGHRFAGSAGDRKAVEWALRTLEAQGFTNVRAEPVTVPRWVRGEASVRMSGVEGGELAALALGGSIGTEGRMLEAEVVAFTNVGELERQSPAAVAGRIVFLYERMLETRDGMDYGTTVRNRSEGAIAAARLGAIALVIRSIGSEDEDRPHTGAMRYANGVPRIPALALGNRSADRLLAAIADGPVTLRIGSNSHCAGSVESANVIGEIPGAGQSGEFVLLGAHLDSWDVGTGAQDDGAGVATVIEAARRIAELPTRPGRGVRVVLYANEEFGLSGAKSYVLRHADAALTHAAAIEADSGSGRVFRFESRLAAGDLPIAFRVGTALAPLGVPFVGNDASGGADLGPLRERGVPVYDLVHDASKYFEIHHTDADRIDRVNPGDLAFNVAAYATVAWTLAEAPMPARAARRWPTPSATVHPCEWRED